MEKIFHVSGSARRTGIIITVYPIAVEKETKTNYIINRNNGTGNKHLNKSVLGFIDYGTMRDDIYHTVYQSGYCLESNLESMKSKIVDALKSEVQIRKEVIDALNANLGNIQTILKEADL